MKKLINRVVSELSSLGLSPTVIHELITDGEAGADKEGEGSGEGTSSSADTSGEGPSDRPRIVYELVEHSDRIEPHLKLWVDVAEPLGTPDGEPSTPDEEVEEGGAKEMKPTTNVLWTLHQKLQERQHTDLEPDSPGSSPGSSPATSPGVDADEITECVRSLLVLGNYSMFHRITSPAVTNRKQEVVIPLVSDTEFFNNLISALEGMSTHMSTVHQEFTKTLKALSRTISLSALPASASPSFHAHSAVSSHPGSIMVSVMQPRQSDLYSWREIFQLYVDAEIFEHVGEVNHGERTAEESEKRLQLFVEQATQRGLADRRKFKSAQSRQAFESFIELNLFILNIKKVRHPDVMP